MKNYNYTIQLFDFWQVTSGASGGVKADSLVSKDKNGLPYISGRTIKGLLRDLADEAHLEDCFGKEGIGEDIKSTFSNASLPENKINLITRAKLKQYLYHKITTTTIDNKTGIAKTDTLRSAEVVVPLTLEGTITLNDQGNCKKTIEQAMSRLKHLGKGRNRGFGRCEIILNDSLENNTKIEAPRSLNKIYLKCTFLDDIVLLGSSNTQGRQKVLDFVPGSAVLGIIAGGINNDSIDTIGFEALLNGSIRFGDGTLLNNGKPTYRIPFSYFSPKIPDKNAKNIYNQPLVDIEEFEKYQMVQIRKGYCDGKSIFSLEYNYEQKSGTPEKNKDKQMYGYPAIRSGTEWLLQIRANNSNHLKQIVSYLCTGTHHIGKSKSAQYGGVRFEIHDGDDGYSRSKNKTNSNLTLLYAKSHLALINTNGQQTFQPSIKNLGLDKGEIDWSKTNIRTTNFSPYNGAQRSTSYERIVIEAGSVIAISNASSELDDKLKIGTFWAEGFGDVWVDPDFLWREYPELILDTQENLEENQEIASEDHSSDSLISYLLAQKRNKDESFDLIKTVDNNISKFHPKITNAQWGALRALANDPNLDDENLFSRVEDFITHGKNKSMWEKGKSGSNLLDQLKTYDNKKLQRKYLQLLCSAKQQESKGGIS